MESESQPNELPRTKSVGEANSPLTVEVDVEDGLESSESLDSQAMTSTELPQGGYDDVDDDDDNDDELSTEQSYTFANESFCDKLDLKPDHRNLKDLDTTETTPAQLRTTLEGKVSPFGLPIDFLNGALTGYLNVWRVSSNQSLYIYTEYIYCQYRWCQNNSSLITLNLIAT